MNNLILATLFLVLGSASSMAVEEATYTSIFSDENFETRYYDPQILAEIEVDGDFEGAGSKAFSQLFAYISGENTSQKKIKMTAPVAQTNGSEMLNRTTPVSQQQKNGKWLVSFMMPSGLSLEELPQPKNPTINLRQLPARHVASIRYSGFWTEKDYLYHLNLLNKWISSQVLHASGAPIWARYNAPYMPWFMRRNEILVPIKKP
jgi:hypothetical protein|tara:strand:- start:1779 stop:2393 length:615 start_codon:yes stop_codon:yes gene_type:complete